MSLYVSYILIAKSAVTSVSDHLKSAKNEAMFPHHTVFMNRIKAYLIRRYPSLCVFAYKYFVFLGRVTNPSAKPPFLEDQFVSLSLASVLGPVRLGRPYQEQKDPAGPQLQTSRKKRPWTPQETMAMRRSRNRSNDLIHGR